MIIFLKHLDECPYTWFYIYAQCSEDTLSLEKNFLIGGRTKQKPAGKAWEVRMMTYVAMTAVNQQQALTQRQ